MAKEKLGELTEVELQGIEAEKTQAQPDAATRVPGEPMPPEPSTAGQETQVIEPDSVGEQPLDPAANEPASEDTVAIDPAETEQ